MRTQVVDQKLSLTVLLTCFLFGVVLFLFGFFPVAYQNYDVGTQSDYTRPSTLNGYRLKPLSSKYEQVVLMLVDALRYDFVQSALMPVSSEVGCQLLKVQVSIPTVTMPRIKSLTTGTISSFIDIVLNLGHSEQLEDSLLHRLYKQNKLVTFAGDHTWIKLFPTKFHRKAANIDSFFVNDFYEGDENVTRSLSTELMHNDWKLLILHYLGLDHIGHVEGTESAKIPLKLKEMDNVIKKIISSQFFSKQLVILTSDHGMRNGGGHGGSTLEELTVPLLYFNSKCKSKSDSLKEYNQIDIAPTLAMLLDIDIPKASIGCLIPELLEEYSLEERLYAFYYNSQHLIQKAVAKYGEKFVNQTDYYAAFIKAKRSHEQFLKSTQKDTVSAINDYEDAVNNYSTLSRTISNELSKSLACFHYDLIAIGLALTTLCAIYILMFVFLLDHNEFPNASQRIPLLLSFVVALGLNICCHQLRYMESRSFVYSSLLTIPIMASFYLLWQIFAFVCTRKYKELKLNLPLLTPLTAFYVFYICSQASSSFIEEEETIWYFLGATTTILVLCNSFSSAVNHTNELLTPKIYNNLKRGTWQLRWATLVPICMGLSRRHKLFAVALNKIENKLCLSAVFLGGLMLLLLQLRKFNLQRAQLLCCVVALSCVYCFRGAAEAVIFFKVPNLNYLVLPTFCVSTTILTALGYKSVITARRAHYILDRHLSIKLMSKLWKTYLCCSLLIAALLHKPQNVILLPAMLFTLGKCYELYERSYSRAHLKAAEQLHVVLQNTLLTFIIGKMYYFCQGNSNSLATIDLNPGYIGQSAYNPLIVGTFVTLNTYCAPINAFLYLISHTIDLNVLASESTLFEHGDQATTLNTKRSTTLLHNEQERLHETICVYTVVTLLPVAVYLWLLVLFRYHLFIYSVFSPKVLYESYNIMVFYLLCCLTNLYCSFYNKFF